MTKEMTPLRVQEGSVINPKDVRILVGVVYDDHMSETGLTGEVASFVCDTQLWVEDGNVEKDTERLLEFVSDDYAHRFIDLRYAQMSLHDYAALVDLRRDMNEYTDAEMVRWARHEFFNLIRPHFEEPLRIPWLSSQVIARSHPTMNFNLFVRHANVR